MEPPRLWPCLTRLRRQPRPNNNAPSPKLGGGPWAVALLACLATPAAAQVTPYAEIDGYSVASVDGQGTCLAATELTSDAGQIMVYTYYQTNRGQRWHVAGFVSNAQLPDGEVAIRAEIDGTETVARMTAAQNGDFMLPFETLPEIEGHEALVKTGEVLTIHAGDTDTLRIPLNDYRAALGAIQACLKAL